MENVTPMGAEADHHSNWSAEEDWGTTHSPNPEERASSPARSTRSRESEREVAAEVEPETRGDESSELQSTWGPEFKADENVTSLKRQTRPSPVNLARETESLRRRIEARPEPMPDTLHFKEPFPVG